ncbi:MAG: ADP-ribosylglycohydrolase family protein [Phycisphaerales bacterium]|nr:ADP-ribosylglycohydrolase family protein [Phycisphaerales bacterium]
MEEARRLIDSRTIQGFMLGSAVGDALGLPREGLSARRAARMFGAGPLQHRFAVGRGMMSDDTEHLCMVVQALLASGGEPDAFARSLAWRLRGWLVGLPAGTGWATLRAGLRLWVGYSWKTSGVFSAGNGPAMRAGILGLYAGEDDERLRRLVHRSTRITHTDPLAEEGALLVALAARYAARHGGDALEPAVFLADARVAVTDDRWREVLDLVAVALERNSTPDKFAESAGLIGGVSGFIVHTVAASLFCWLRYAGDFRAGVEGVIRLGGDTDSTAAITGGLLGAALGAEAIPAEWCDRLCEWPRSVNWMMRLAERLSDATSANVADAAPLPLFWPGLIVRNLCFGVIVLLHALRRMFPPYAT